MIRQLAILMVSDLSPLSSSGGRERIIREMATGLSARGHRVTLLCRAAERGERRETSDQGVTVKPFLVDRGSRLRFLRSSIFSPGAMAADLIGRHQVDLLHVHQPMAGYGSIFSSGGHPLPVVYTFHAPAPAEYRRLRGSSPFHRRGLAGILGSSTLRLMERLCLRRSSRVHVLSDHAGKLARSHYRVPERKLARIVAGADLFRFKEAVDRAEIRRRLGLETAGRLLLTICSLESRTGVDLLIRAVAKLRARHAGILLVIGGEGAQMPDLQALSVKLGAGDSVKMAGAISEERLPLYYQAADFFLLPASSLESFDLGVAESLACGTPAIGTRIGSAPEMIRNLGREFILWELSPDGVADQIEGILDKWPAGSPESEDLRRTCRRHAEEFHSGVDQIKMLEDQMIATVDEAGARKTRG